MGADPLLARAVESVQRRHGLGPRTCRGYERPPARPVEAAMPCPKCGGPLDYAVSSYDGATRGSCRTPGCLRWAE